MWKCEALVLQLLFCFLDIKPDTAAASERWPVYFFGEGGGGGRAGTTFGLVWWKMRRTPLVFLGEDSNLFATS